MLYRHGDILLQLVDELPSDARPLATLVLARGEVTGHNHRIQRPESATLWEAKGMLYLQVVADTATLVHEEHAPITLPHGLYRFWQQREYTPQAIRRVVE